MNIAILGTGRVARTLGDGLAKRGHAVTLASRQPDAVDVSLPVTAHSEAIASADLVVNAIAGAQALDAPAGRASWPTRCSSTSPTR